MTDLDAIRERAEHLLNHWTEPAFCRPWTQDAALTSARDVLALVGRIQELEVKLPDWQYAEKEHELRMKAEAERDTLREALDMLWTYYLLPISDEQKQQVIETLA